MRHRPLLLIALLAACASSPIAREAQYAKGIVSANEATTTLLDFDLITPEQGEAIQAITRTATADLRRATAARRAGQPGEVTLRILDLIESALLEVSRLLAQAEGK